VLLEFSTGEMGIFQPALPDTTPQRRAKGVSTGFDSINIARATCSGTACSPLNG
jgi:hypothetical protein